MTAQGLLITGTDTGCGKTEISLALMQLYQARGECVLGMKPVASGAERTADGLRNADALRLQAQGSRALPYGQVNPYAFAPPIAPHLAAQQAGVVVELQRIQAGYAALAGQSDRVIVEGVGGWRVPLNAHESVSDLALRLGLPVVLVVGLRLGCINHALLSVESIQASGAELAGWVANQVERDMRCLDENVEALRRRIDAPCLGVVPFMVPPSVEAVAGLLRWPEGL